MTQLPLRALLIAAAVSLAACADNDLEDPAPFDSVPFGESVPPAPRTEDLELAPGPDLEVTPSEVASAQAFEEEAGVTSDTLDQVLGAAPPQTAAITPQSGIIGGSIGKVISKIVITIPKNLIGKIVIGGFRPSTDLFDGKNLYFPKDESTPLEAMRNALMSISGLACASKRVPLQPPPAAQAEKLAQKLGGKTTSYELCVPSTYVDKKTGAQISVRVYLDTRPSPPKPVAYRAVTSTASKSNVYELPANLF